MIVSDDEGEHALPIDGKGSFDVDLPEVIGMFCSEKLPFSFSSRRKTIPLVFLQNHVDALSAQQNGLPSDPEDGF
jgi:hypothetical protein